MKKYIISQEILASIMNYLSKRPYAEVAQGINALQNLPEYEVSEKTNRKDLEVNNK